MTDAAGSPSTARDRAIEVVTEELDQHAGSAADAAEWAVAALCTVPGLLRALAGEAEPTPADADERLDDVQGWLHEQNEATDGPMYARTLGLVQDQATEVEQLRWERDMALSRVAAAEDVQCRMGESLPASGPWESWSERDRAVRDYEGDLSAALATEDDTVGERLREVERERDEALAEVEQLRVNYQNAIDESIRRGGQIAELQEALYKRRVEVERARPVVEAVEVWNDKWMAGEAGVSAGTELHNVLVKYLARDHAAVYRAGGSAPHQGATTDVTALLGRCEDQETAARITGSAAMLRTDEVRALLGAGETTEETT